MSEVQKYEPSQSLAGVMCKSEEGSWVDASDYDALAAECERWKTRCQYNADTAHSVAAERDAALAELAALKGGQDDADLAQRMKAAGMLSVAELMAGQPLDGFQRHAGVHDLATFAQWLEMRRTECLKMHARFQLEGREDDDELYEWVIAHSAVFNEAHINFKAAIAAPPAQASAWVPDGWKLVPVQMTESMLDAAWCACSGLDDGDIRDMWRAMLAAAPIPGASDGKGGES